ncbi:MAG TPA: sulfatase-like hydrolase/transferase [Niabella sp.]|mgnify:CR=1 FL=1|nr:sulfatase-like hydrolase/transferase [Niabella sp.]HOZ95437.1 sulfatase-like hydrolase/transferase [Niabella sp.]HQW14327.1 sulfatase-like hydrolase/transferase [Niabella sp.]HQX18394.1 sulfatase-like hydrolase/transferase [Niabella sp.]HQX40114.1 sulfatase-like hydrolase/transferase [Niabella sp.]
MIRLCKLFLCALLILLFGTLVQGQVQKPNIIVIVSDDAGYADFQLYGHKEIPTPNIRRLANEGVRFTNAYVTASVCAPSRAGLITGRYQQRFGFEHNPSSKLAPGFTLEDVGVDLKQSTIADDMKANGYRTIAIGKWHLGNLDKYFPLKRGFDEFYGFREGHRDFFSYKEKVKDGFALYDNYSIVPEEKISYLTDMLTERAIAFVDHNKTNPFFMYLAYNAVHTPLQAKQIDMDQFGNIHDKDRRTYDAMMHNMDKGIGKLFETIKNNGLEQNTLIFFINDNGGATNNGSDNGALRGMKGSKWEGGIRVAFLMKWAGQIKSGIVYDNPVSALDILPTSLAAVGVPMSKERGDGVNLLPFLHGSSGKPHQDLFWRRGVAAAVRSGRWKLIRVKSDPILLFDLKTDISETKNLAAKNPKKVKELLTKLSQWEKELDQPHWYSIMGDENQIRKHRMEVVGREMEKMLP